MFTGERKSCAGNPAESCESVLMAECPGPKDKEDEEVLGFIREFLTHNTTSDVERELLRSLFMSGYCYYFAGMLQKAFNRGKVCWCAPYGHFVWVDNNGIPYDIEGRSSSEADCFIPEEYMGEAINDFKHIPGKQFNASQKQIDEIIEKYRHENWKE